MSHLTVSINYNHRVWQGGFQVFIPYKLLEKYRLLSTKWLPLRDSFAVALRPQSECRLYSLRAKD